MLVENALNIPMKWRKPSKIFVDSMSDLFHEDIPLSYITKVFDIMHNCPQHQFQILTKRSERLAELSRKLAWTEHIWMGVSIESQDYTQRIEDLKNVPAHIRWISFEPLIGPIDKMDLTGIHWVVVGGESGPRFRPMDPDWARGIRDKCIEQNVRFFFKQWSGHSVKKLGRILDGKLWNQYPEIGSRKS